MADGGSRPGGQASAFPTGGAAAAASTRGAAAAASTRGVGVSPAGTPPATPPHRRKAGPLSPALADEAGKLLPATKAGGAARSRGRTLLFSAGAVVLLMLAGMAASELNLRVSVTGVSTPRAEPAAGLHADCRRAGISCCCTPPSCCSPLHALTLFRSTLHPTHRPSCRPRRACLPRRLRPTGRTTRTSRRLAFGHRRGQPCSSRQVPRTRTAAAAAPAGSPRCCPPPRRRWRSS